MRQTVVILAISGTLALSPAPAVTQEEESGGRLVRLLESTLSGDGRTISVVGLEGALSSRATIEKITVSDDEGVWFTLENAVLDWNRLALVRGRFSVNALSAERIIVARPPGVVTTPDEPVAPETKPFALPELPVAIEIGQIAVTEIDLGEALVGTAAQLSLDGSLTLADGELDADLDLERLDRVEDSFVLDTSFSNATRELVLKLTVKEGSGGLIGTAIKLPGSPDLRLSIDGDGPLEDFDAAVALETDGELRFGGDVTLKGLTPEEVTEGQVEEVPLRFTADLGGDIRPLLPEDYHAFFGPDTRLQTTGQRSPDGALSLDTLNVNSDALTLDGELHISADGEVQQAVLQSAIRPPEGDTVVLPVPGGDTTLERVRLNALYDADEGRDWVLDGLVKGFKTPDLTVAELTLTGRGETGAVPEDDDISGSITADLSGLAFADPALQSAAGDALSLTGDFRLKDEGNLVLDDMTFGGAGIAATVDATISGLDSGMRIEAQGTVDADDIARFSDLAGQQLAGALQAKFDGHYVALSGAFDVKLDGASTDLAVGIAQVDPLLTGRTDLVVDAARDEKGITLRKLTVDGTALTAEADGLLSSSGSTFNFDANVDDLARVVPELPGPGKIKGNVEETKGIYDGKVVLTAPRGINLTADGTYGPGKTALTIDGGLDDLGIFVPQLPGAASLSGDVKEDNGAYVGQFTLNAPKGVKLDADGRYVEGGTTLNLNAGLDDLGIFVPQLPGPATVTGKVDQDGDGAYVGTVNVDAAQGVKATANGRYAGSDIEGQFRAGLDDLAIFVPQLPGPATVTGDVTGTDGDFTGTVNVAATPGLAVKADGTYGPSGTELTFDGTLDDLGIFVPQLAGLAKIDGQVKDIDGAYVGNVNVDAAAGARMAANGTYVEGGTKGTFNATLDDLGAFAPQLPGAARIDGTVAEDNSGAYVGKVNVSAPKGIQLTADGQYIEGGTKLTLDGQLDDLAVFVPQMPGSATLDGTVDEVDSAYQASLRLRTENASEANLDGVYGEEKRSVRFDALLANLGAFVAQLPGSVQIKGTADEVDGTYNADVAVDGTAGVTLTADGAYTPEGASNVTFDFGLDRVERFVADFPGRFTAKGKADATGDDVSITADASGPAGVQASLSGTYGLKSGQANITTKGQAQLAAANTFIAPMAVSGPVQFDLRLNGEPGLPALAGTISVPGARVAVPQVAGQIDPLQGQITLNNGTATVGFDGTWSDGGSFRISGPVDLTAPYSAGIEVALNNLVLTDDNLYRTQLAGQIRANGPLAGNAQIGGVVNIGATELNIAASTGGSGVPIPTIQHVGETAAEFATRQRAGLVVEDDGGDGGGGGGPVYGLNVTISAPRQIFVRGRGLDAELGGGLSLTGTTQNVVPVGEINLIRGRLDLVGRRLDLDRGLVSLQGSFDPYFEFEASNTSSAGTATLKFFGSFDDPEVEVTSSPERPPEEALGLLVFGDQFNNLSPLKIAQLASSLATLTGKTGAGGGILGGARSELGVSSLDLTTDEDGNAQVGVGTYLTDNIYSDVAVNTEGRTQLNLNLDVSNNITAKGKVDNEGNSSIGLFFSKDF